VTVEVSLQGKVALVTGVGPNIGSGIALALARYGARVACNDVDPAAVKACLARIERNGGEAMAAPGDVTDEAAVQGYVGDVLARWGHIDILVNNAALLGGRGVLDETAEFFERAVRVSALGYFLNTKHVGRAMAERGIKGSIICISSSNGWTSSAGIIAYAFNKGGVNNFVRAAAMDLAPYGIRVNSFTPTAPNPDNPELIAERDRAGLAPGGILNQRGGGLGGPSGDEEWRRPTRWPGQRAPMIPMGTTGTPTDIGHAVAWLCSDYARLITGIDLVVDGGARAKNFAYAPAAPEELAGPLPLITLDVTPPYLPRTRPEARPRRRGGAAGPRSPS
jgi:NAD(P)-dependent dehydrogenase (short-subunit alcohol dehydrogenase family)